MMRRFVLIPIVSVLVSSACVPTDFEDRRAEAQTVALAPPDDYAAANFGEVVVGYGGMLSGTTATRIAGSAGSSSPFSVYPLLIGDEVRLDTPVMDGCDAESPCDRGSSASLVGVPSYDGRAMCLMTASPETGQLKIRCEDNPTRFETIPGPGGERFGESAAGLPGPHAWGVAIFGASTASGGNGAVYRLGTIGPPSRLDLSEGMGTGRDLGRALAIGAIDADTVLVAASATGRVILATSDVAADGTITTRSRGCVDDPGPGFGQVLAIGDFDGDGAPDVAIASSAGAGRSETIQILAGSSMPTEGSCAGAWPPAITLGCPSVAAAEGIDCVEFGAALTAGDVNADGIDDLIVGAPGAEVDGVGGAGAVFVFAGDLVMANVGRDVAALRHSRPETGAGLGRSVAAVPGQTFGGTTRYEVAAGAPGAGRIYVFLCSPGLSADEPTSLPGSRCQPLDN